MKGDVVLITNLPLQPQEVGMILILQTWGLRLNETDKVAQSHTARKWSNTQVRLIPETTVLTILCGRSAGQRNQVLFNQQQKQPQVTLILKVIKLQASEPFSGTSQSRVPALPDWRTD